MINDIEISEWTVSAIDRTIADRVELINEPAFSTYTTELLRNPNKAGKKAGEEFAEVMMAIMADECVEACEAEIADLMYAVVVAAQGRGKRVAIAQVLRILIARNIASAQATPLAS
jgi:phosphoribosyl-ATP pyrophosphohydrolase